MDTESSIVSTSFICQPASNEPICRKPAVPRRRDGVELESQMRKLVGVLLTAAAITSVVIGGPGAPAGTTLAAAPAACTGIVQVTSFTFSPSSVSPGGRSTATLTVQNCTSSAVSISG